AVALARRPRHDGNAGLEQIVLGELEVRAAAAEQPREEPLEVLVDLVEGFLEARARFAIHPANRLLERRERLRQVLGLLVEVALAARKLLELLDRDQVDRPEALDAVRNALEALLPGGLVRLGRHFREHLRELGPALAHLIREGVAAHQELLTRDALRLERGAHRLRLAFLVHARLLLAPQLGIDLARR